MCSGRVSSSCCTIGTRRVNLVTTYHALAYWQQQRHEHQNMFIPYLVVNDLQKQFVIPSVLLIKSHIYICCISHLHLIYQECVNVSQLIIQERQIIDHCTLLSSQAYPLNRRTRRSQETCFENKWINRSIHIYIWPRTYICWTVFNQCIN